MEKTSKYTFIFSVLLCVFGFITNATVAQTAIDADILEEIIENLADEAGEDADFSEFYDELFALSQSPVAINQCVREELDKLIFLSAYQIDNLWNYKQRYGTIYSIFELLLVDGFSRKDVERLQYFIHFETSERKQMPFAKMLKYSNKTLINRLQYVPELNQLKAYQRYSMRFGKEMSIGITAEKDGGEKFFATPQKMGFDFYSAHFEINNRGKLKKWIVGDFSPHFGQGLTMSQGFGSRKSANVLNVELNTNQLKRYTSTDENKFMRGMGATFSLGKVELSTFLSYKKIDANIEQTSEGKQITSLPLSGIHVTESEIQNKNAAKEAVAGLNISYLLQNFRIGMSLVGTAYNFPLKKDSEIYHRFKFSGKQALNAGIDYRYAANRFSLFGETSVNQNFAFATLNGLRYSPMSRAAVVLLHRAYSPAYQSFYSTAFAEGSAASNEKGIYFGVELFPVKYLKMNMYADVFKFDWLKYLVNAPSHGSEYFVQTEYLASRLWLITARFKYEHKYQNTSAEGTIKPLTDIEKRTLRLHSAYRVSPNLELRTRLEFSQFTDENGTENGLLLYQDIVLGFSSLPLKLSFRYAIFDTPSYNSRMYAYESDVLNSFSVPAYYSKGVRTYCLLKYDFNENFDIQMRFAITSYSDKDVIGSGLTEIDGNHKSEIKCLLRMKF